MKRWEKWAAGAALLCLVRPAAALGPDGHGWLNLSADFEPGKKVQEFSVNNGVYTHDTSYSTHNGFGGEVEWRQPLTRLASLDLAGGLSQASHDIDQVFSPGPFTGELDDVYNTAYQNAQVGLWLYPWAWFGGLEPGPEVNPDGWLLRPNLTAGYAFSWSQGSGAVATATGSIAGHTFSLHSNTYSGSGGYGVKLPVLPWLTLGGNYTRGYESAGQTQINSGPERTSQGGGSVEMWSAYARLYWDRGSDADGPRAWMPTLGYEGTWRVELNWSRTYDFRAGRVLEYDYHVGGLYALSESVGLSLDLGLTEETAGPLDSLMTAGSTESLRNLNPVSIGIGVRYAFSGGGVKVMEPRP